MDYIGKKINKEQIDEIIEDFPGKEDFVVFYMTHNGGDFTYGAWFFPDACYNVLPDYRCLTVANFLPVPVEDDSKEKQFRELDIEYERDLTVEKFSNFEDFVLFHIPFALDAGGNTFWIDIQSGEIKYTDFYEKFNPDPKDVITVAFSFKDFCKGIKKRNI